MSVSGLCQICEAAEATHRCDQCGNLVCEGHFDPPTGYCTECLRQSRGDADVEGGHRF